MDVIIDDGDGDTISDGNCDCVVGDGGGATGQNSCGGSPNTPYNKYKNNQKQKKCK